MLDLRAHIRPGDGVWWSQAGAEALPLVDALFAQIRDVRAFCGLTVNPRIRELPDGIDLHSYGALGELRAVSRAGRLTVVPAHYSALPRLFAERLLPGDVGLLQVSPPGPDGRCSFGIGADYAPDAAAHSRVLIGEINQRMPVTDGPSIPFERFAATVETDRPLPEVPDRGPDAVDTAIAARVAELVEDGDTVQMGVGTLPTAIMGGLSGHRDLGFHAGLVGDSVLRLVEKGVLTGRHKEIDTGLVVTGMAIGTAELYGRLGEPPFAFRPASYTHSPGGPVAAAAPGRGQRGDRGRPDRPGRRRDRGWVPPRRDRRAGRLLRSRGPHRRPLGHRAALHGPRAVDDRARAARTRDHRAGRRRRRGHRARRRVAARAAPGRPRGAARRDRRPRAPGRVAASSPGASSPGRAHRMSSRTAFVTGAAQGIGAGIATTLGAQGFRVAVVDLHLDAALATATAIGHAGGTAIAVQADVTDTGAVRAAVKTVTDELGPVEVAVNNAGWDDFMNFVDTTEEFWDRVIDVNFKGALRVAHAVVPGRPTSPPPSPSSPPTPPGTSPVRPCRSAAG